MFISDMRRGGQLHRGCRLQEGCLQPQWSWSEPGLSALSIDLPHPAPALATLTAALISLMKKTFSDKVHQDLQRWLHLKLRDKALADH